MFAPGVVLNPNFEITCELQPILLLGEGRLREGTLCGFFVV